MSACVTGILSVYGVCVLCVCVRVQKCVGYVNADLQTYVCIQGWVLICYQCGNVFMDIVHCTPVCVRRCWGQKCIHSAIVALTFTVPDSEVVAWVSWSVSIAPGSSEREERRREEWPKLTFRLHLY